MTISKMWLWLVIVTGNIIAVLNAFDLLNQKDTVLATIGFVMFPILISVNILGYRIYKRFNKENTK